MAKALKTITDISEIREKAEAYGFLTLKEKEQFLKIFDENTKNRILSEFLKIKDSPTEDEKEMAKNYSLAFDKPGGRQTFIKHFSLADATVIFKAYVKVNNFGAAFLQTLKNDYLSELRNDTDIYENAKTDSIRLSFLKSFADDYANEIEKEYEKRHCNKLQTSPSLSQNKPMAKVLKASEITEMAYVIVNTPLVRRAAILADLHGLSRPKVVKEVEKLKSEGKDIYENNKNQTNPKTSTKMAKEAGTREKEVLDPKNNNNHLVRHGLTVIQGIANLNGFAKFKDLSEKQKQTLAGISDEKEREAARRTIFYRSFETLKRKLKDGQDDEYSKDKPVHAKALEIIRGAIKVYDKGKGVKELNAMAEEVLQGVEAVYHKEKVQRGGVNRKPKFTLDNPDPNAFDLF